MNTEMNTTSISDVLDAASVAFRELEYITEKGLMNDGSLVADTSAAVHTVVDLAGQFLMTRERPQPFMYEVYELAVRAGDTIEDGDFDSSISLIADIEYILNRPPTV